MTIRNEIARRMPGPEYRRHPGVSRGDLWPIVYDSPAEAKWIRDNGLVGQDEPDHFRFGSAAHCRILEPGRFGEIYIVRPRFPSTKDGKRRAEAWDRDHRGLRWVYPDEAAQLDELAELIEDQCPEWQAYRAPLRSDREISLFWADVEGGQAKGRIDSLHPRRRVQVDLKTTRHQQAGRWLRDLREHGIIHQQAWYRDGARALGLDVELVLLIGLCPSTPGTDKRMPTRARIHVLPIPEEDLNIAAAQMEEALRIYRECERTGEWPEGEQTVTAATLPAWQKARFYQGDRTE